MTHPIEVDINPVDQSFTPRVDRVTYEILKHRLWQINEEQATTIRRVSGSPIASEVQDYNVGIATAEGKLVACGMSVLAHVTALSHVIKNCMKIIGEGKLRDGDMFITNDPWMGAVHQNDVALVAPIIIDGALVAWTSSVIHHADVGGPVPGSWNLDAYDAFQEAPRYRFLRIVRDGEIADEVMATLMTNSRTPALAELDLRAQVAAAGVVRRRMTELFDKYGAQIVVDVMADSLRDSEIMLRNRIRALPDGVWKTEEHVDHDGHSDSLTTIRLTLTKSGDTLIFDFTDSDDEAAGLINCTRPTLESGPFSAVLTHLCAGMTWNEGIMDRIRIDSRPGSIVDCNFPAPVASGVINSGWAALDASAAAVARMMLDGQESRKLTMAGWAGAPYGVNIFGKRENGRSFATMLGLSGLQGGGARSFADGYDAAGYLHSPRCGAMNVETAEARFPILHLFRRLAPDSGGAGQYRGGRSVEMAITSHGATQAEVIVTSFGSDHSGSPGLAGGMPGAGALGALVHTKSDSTGLIRQCADRTTTLSAGDVTSLPSKARVALNSGDVFLSVTHGGGGFGDPRRRSVDAVAQDLASGAVTGEWAARLYNVHMASDGTIDIDETNRLRQAPVSTPVQAPVQTPVQADDGRPLTQDELPVTLPQNCPHCEEPLWGQNGKASTPLMTTADLAAAGPLIAARVAGISPRFRLVTLSCAQCAGRIEVFQQRIDK